MIDVRRITGLFRKGIRNPRAGPEVCKALCRSQWHKLYRRRHDIPRQTQLIDRLTEHAEYTIIILDACRFDYFQEEFEEHLQGELRKVWSAGNYTAEYLRNIWSDDHEISYVSANPWVSDYRWETRPSEYTPSEHIKNIVGVWRFGWDSHKHAVLPETVTDAALREIKRGTADRLVVHYNQPHFPYIGETQILPWEQDVSGIDFTEIERCNSETEKQEFLRKADEIGPVEAYRYDISPDEIAAYDLDRSSLQAPEKIEREGITPEQLAKAYRDNLRVVLREVRRLIEYLNEPVIITADHGEFLGEDGKYMHPATLSVGAHALLREVPWLEVDPSILNVADISDVDISLPESTEVSREGVEERLKQLGYKM